MQMLVRHETKDFLVCCAVVMGLLGTYLTLSQSAPRNTHLKIVPKIASPSLSYSTKPECIDLTYQRLSPIERVSQLIMVGVSAEASPAHAAKVVDAQHPGGVILTGRSREGVDAVIALTRAAQAKARATEGNVGLFISVDQEGGTVQVLSGPGFSRIPSAATQGTLSIDELEGLSRKWGEELRAAGINVVLAPVADVLSAALGSRNQAIGRYNRAYGTDPDTVARHASAYIRGMVSAGITPTLKHFPGLGRVAQNTDYSTGVFDDQTTSVDPALRPFRVPATHPDPFMMVSSVIYQKVDSKNPAVFSVTIIQHLLRGVQGFAGLVLSDDLGDAKQVQNVSPGDRAVRFIDAGGDLIITVDPATAPLMTDGIMKRSAGDPTFSAKVEATVQRVLGAKFDRGLVSC
jgi:beta-N-acetylhexosaminidase